MSTLLLNPVASGFGHVTFDGVSTYTRVTAQPISHKQTIAGTNEKAAFASFDLSSLPVGMTPTKVELISAITAFPVSGEVNVLIRLVDDALESSDADLYNAITTSAVTLATRAAAVGTFTDNLGATGVSSVNELFLAGAPFNVGWKFGASGNYDITLGAIPQLRITYTPPTTGNPPADEPVNIAQHSSGTLTWAVTDSDGNARDLTGEDLRLNVFDTRTQSIKFSKSTDDDLTISTSNVLFTYDEDDSDTADTYRYNLWIIGDSDELIRQGFMTVSPTVKDVPS